MSATRYSDEGEIYAVPPNSETKGNQIVPVVKKRIVTYVKRKVYRESSVGSIKMYLTSVLSSLGHS